VTAKNKRMERGEEKIAGSVFMTHILNEVIARINHHQSQFGPIMIVQTTLELDDEQEWSHKSAPFRFNHVSKKWFIGAFAFPTSKALVKFLAPMDKFPVEAYADLRIFATIKGTDFVEFPHNEVEVYLGHEEDTYTSYWEVGLEILLEKMKFLPV